MREPIAAEKVEGLRRELDAHGKVRFKTGAVVETITRYQLTTPLGAKVVGTEKELGRLYSIALRGMQPLEQPATQEELAERWGDEAPW